MCYNMDDVASMLLQHARPPCPPQNPYYDKWNNPVTEKQMLHDYIYIRFLKQSKLIETKQRAEWRLLGVGGRGKLGDAHQKV